MDSDKIITAFYSAFSEGDAQAMTNYYSDAIIFEDPAFGQLVGDRAKAMWEMLISRSKGDLQIEFNILSSSDNLATAEWIATYHYGSKRRKVINHVTANFELVDGKIVRHKDDFDFHKWASQALGFTGNLLGNTKFLKKKVQGKTNELLSSYIANKKENNS